MSEHEREDIYSDLSQCEDCRHYYGEHRCAAFPHRIPLAIQNNEIMHTSPIEGDNGIVFEPK